MKIIFLCVISFLYTFCHSQTAKDTLFFINGSLLVGEIKKVKLGVVTFDPDDANDVTIQLRKLKTIHARTKIFRVETVTDRIYFGILTPHPAQNTVYIITAWDTVSLNLQNISALHPFEKSLVQRFSGNVGLGYSYTRTSGFGRLNFDGYLKYVSRKEELILTTSLIYTLYDSLISRDREEFSIKFNYFFVRNWFTTVFVAYQRNLELGLQRRFQEGVGIGNKFITGKNAYTWARGGVVFNQEKSTESVTSGVLTELFGQLEVNIFRFEKPEISLLLKQALFYSLSQSGRFRNDGSTKVTWEVFEDFNLNLELYSNYDSKPPVSESRKFDFGIVFGFSYKF